MDKIRDVLGPYMDVDAAANEMMMLAALPAVCTAAWKGFLLVDQKSPFICPLILMVIIAFTLLYFKTGEKGLQSRIFIDALVVTGTILYGNKAFPLEGPSPPDSWDGLMYSFVGITCIIATVRSLEFMLTLGEKKFLR